MGESVKGKFITFEGSEGSGKSTQIKMVHDYLTKKGFNVIQIREPGGVKISETIRKVLLDIENTQMCSECEVLLYMAARAQLVEEVILPALKKGAIILCDRFLDSTLVYQGFGNGVNLESIKQIGQFAVKDVRPDLTLLFDIETKKGLSRTGRVKDRIERRPLTYHNRVRQGYLALAKEEPARIKMIQVNAGKAEIFDIVRSHIDAALNLS